MSIWARRAFTTAQQRRLLIESGFFLLDIWPSIPDFGRLAIAVRAHTVGAVVHLDVRGILIVIACNAVYLYSVTSRLNGRVQVQANVYSMGWIPIQWSSILQEEEVSTLMAIFEEWRAHDRYLGTCSAFQDRLVLD